MTCPPPLFDLLAEAINEVVLACKQQVLASFSSLRTWVAAASAWLASCWRQRSGWVRGWGGRTEDQGSEAGGQEWEGRMWVCVGGEDQGSEARGQEQAESVCVWGEDHWLRVRGQRPGVGGEGVCVGGEDHWSGLKRPESRSERRGCAGGGGRTNDQGSGARGQGPAT